MLERAFSSGTIGSTSAFVSAFGKPTNRLFIGIGILLLNWLSLSNSTSNSLDSSVKLASEELECGSVGLSLDLLSEIDKKKEFNKNAEP